METLWKLNTLEIWSFYVISTLRSYLHIFVKLLKCLSVMTFNTFTKWHCTVFTKHPHSSFFWPTGTQFKTFDLNLYLHQGINFVEISTCPAIHMTRKMHYSIQNNHQSSPAGRTTCHALHIYYNSKEPIMTSSELLSTYYTPTKTMLAVAVDIADTVVC